MKEAQTIIKLVRGGDSNLNAIWANAVRDGHLSISRSTFYKYTRILGLKSPIKTRNKKKLTKIRASRPHEIWHADITEVEMKTSLFFIQFKNQLILNYKEKQIYRGTDSIYASPVRFWNEGGGHLSRQRHHHGHFLQLEAQVCWYGRATAQGTQIPAAREPSFKADVC